MPTLRPLTRSGMASADPQAHRWSSAKLLFDYTPYATRSDWIHRLADERWMWQKHERKCSALKQSVSQINWYAKRSDIWKHFKPEEWSCFPRLAEDLGLASSIGCESATEQLAEEEPYVVFRRSDWARNGIGPKLREMPLSRRENITPKYMPWRSNGQCHQVNCCGWVARTHAIRNISLSIKKSMPGSMENSAL